jgi:hypothetical protein
MNRIDTAYQFYDQHINDKEKLALIKEHNLKTAGSVPSVLWELFGSLLTGKTGNGLKGADLQGWEVKSVKMGGSYEYQYHLNTGSHKILEDCEVSHLFCSYSENYQDVVVRVIPGSLLADSFFLKWEPEYRKNYQADAPAESRRQRFRKSIPYRYVENNGLLLLQIADAKIVYRNDELLNTYSG